MAPITIHEAPMPESFKSREDHETQTPESFYDGKPVLYFRAKDATAVLTAHHFPAPSIFNLPCGASPEDRTRIKEKVDVMVTSRNLILFNNKLAKGMEIPYPDMPIVATARLDDEPALLIHFDSSSEEPDEQMETDPRPIELYLVPKPDEVDGLYSAIQVCSDLNPDPPSQEDEDMEDGFGDRIAFEGNVGYTGISGLPGISQGAPDGGLPPVFPGSSGWITAENVHEYFDEDGLWIKGMGPGAGRVRTRDENEADGENGSEREENKRARTIEESVRAESANGTSDQQMNGNGALGDATNVLSTNGFGTAHHATNGDEIAKA